MVKRVKEMKIGNTNVPKTSKKNSQSSKTDSGMSVSNPPATNQNRTAVTTVKEMSKPYNASTVREIHVLPNKDGWIVKSEVNPNPSENYPTQKEAIQAARKIAVKHHSELLIHGKNGLVRDISGFLKVQKSDSKRVLYPTSDTSIDRKELRISIYNINQKVKKIDQ
jgi:hypothetical protein